MLKIQDLFDPSKQLNRTIESVVTFGAKTVQDLNSEIREYVVTNKLHQNYESVIQDLQSAFDNGSKEVGVWVSGFYGSGKSSFAKYLGLSFDKSLLIDGVAFGDKLMSRINDVGITAMHKTIIARHNPQVVMIDLSTQNPGGKIALVSDIVYYETLKLLGITSSSDQKVMSFIDMLHNEGKYDEFCQLVETEKKKTWKAVESNDLIANMFAAEYAPRLLPAYFPDSDSYNRIVINTAENEKERFTRLIKLIKEKTGHDRVIFVLDEVGQYVASNVDLILNVQGMMQIFKDEFRGNVWVIATAQQTLTEDNRNAQLNSNELFRLNDRFPVKVDIEANDIKEIITKRLLGKSNEGYNHLKKLFNQNEGALKNNIHLSLQARSIYNQVLTEESFANLYPFLPVHIDILLSLLQKLASRTGGVGLRSVIRLIRDILVDNHLADATIGQMAGPEHFYDVLRSDMEKGATKEVVIAADKAIQVFNGNALAVRICKTIAVMQILDDFNLSFDNICALLYNNVGGSVDKAKVREILEEITTSDGLTLQEIDGKYQFMTNAILGIREERNKIIPRESEKADVLQEQLKDMMSPAPSVNVYSSKTITAGVELTERNRPYSIYPTQSLKLNVRFVTGANFEETRQQLLTESTRKENERTLYWLCTLAKDKEDLLQEIVRSQTIRNRHLNETNKEIQAYLRAQQDIADEKKRDLNKLLRDAWNNSEIIFKGTPQQVNADTYKTVALKQIAEKVFEKYPMASANMKGDCVTNLAKFADITTIPASLNPFGIIDTKKGIIDPSYSAISELKDFIAYRNETTGQELTTHFEKDPYGWSKDTIRYLVALMLKASIIQIRVSGKNITVFGESAVEAMSTNNNFSKISISLNTEGELTVPELLKAAQNLTALFNSGRIAPVKDQIAQEAFKKVKYYLPRFNKLLPDFEFFQLAGLQLFKQAINYSQRIIETEGGDAAFLLGKDADCNEAFRYAMDILKCNDQSKVLDSLKHVAKLTSDSTKLPNIPLLSEFRKHVGDVTQLLNDYIANPNIHQIASEITDLSNQANSYVNEACIAFQTEGNIKIAESRENIKKMEGFDKLTDAEQQQIVTLADGLSLEFASPTLDNLREMVNSYTTLYLPNGGIDAIRSRVTQLVAKHAPAVVTTPPVTSFTPSTSTTDTPTAHETEKKPRQMKLKRSLTTRNEVQLLITELQNHLDDVSEEHPIEFSINE